MKHVLNTFLALLFSVVCLFGQSAVQPVGDGSSGNPYQITTLNNLYWLTQNSGYWSTGKYFKQTANINASTTSGWDGGNGFLPIGTSAAKFNGYYDGQGFTVSNLYIHRTSTYFVGLFGYINGGTISNLGVVSVNITGYTYVGGLVGGIEPDADVSITNCCSSGSVSSTFTGADYYGTGGLIGETNCQSGNLTITKCFSSCSASGYYSVGGLLGIAYVSGTNISIDNCYSTGSVTGTSDAGGLVGKNFSFFNDITITNCYSTGSVSGSSNIGGLVGSDENYGNITVSGCYWDTQTSGQSSSAGGTGKNTAQMKLQSTFSGWDFTTPIWKINSSYNNGYPYLNWAESILPVELTSFDAISSGTEVSLTWQTATEVNNYGFNVECRMYNEEWKTIGFVEGSGNSNSLKEYSFTDKDVTEGKYCYRLKQIDTDGSYTYSKEVEVRIENIPAEFALYQNYPNPFNPTTKIEFSIPSDNNIEIKVFNVLGMEVATLLNEHRQAGTHSIEFNASNLSSGIYFYKIVSGKYSEIKKMILLK